MADPSWSLGTLLATVPVVLSTSLRYAVKGAPHPSLSLTDTIKAAIMKKTFEERDAVWIDQSTLSIEQRMATAFAKSVTVRAELLDPVDEKYYAGELTHPLVRPAQVPVFFLRPRKGLREGKIVLYIHGGGYGRGDAAGSGISNALANRLGRETCTIDYRLGGTEPFPAAVQDCVTAYFHLRKTHRADQIVLCGESAGGGLVLATLLHLRGLDELPDRAVLMSPLMQTASTSYGSWRKYDGFDFISVAGLVEVSRGYTSLRPKSPYIQLFDNSFRGLPPLFVTYGDAEILADDDREFCERARRDGVEVTEEVGVAKTHVWIALPHEQAVARPVWAKMKHFVDAAPIQAKL